LLGTFLMVLFGTGSLAVSILFDAYNGLLQIALVWGTGVTLAIYLTRHLSCAHLNPAVSIAMVLGKRMKISKLPLYLVAQFLGALLAGGVVYLLFGPSISAYELNHSIVRGTEASIQTGKMFGEYYAAPGSTAVVTLPLAMAAEALGTFILLLLIFALTEGCNVGRPDNAMAPVFIGLSVTSVICLIGPLTQAGLNPARDFGPRLIALMAGWGKAALPDSFGGFFWVYMLAPVAGGIVATFFFVKFIEPAMNKPSTPCNC